jgi:hypothetical protein
MKRERRRTRGGRNGTYIFWLLFLYRYILEARKKALAKKKKLRTLGKKVQSADSEDEMEVDGKFLGLCEIK